MDSSSGLFILETSLTVLTILADIASAEGASEPSETGPKGNLIYVQSSLIFLSRPNKIEPQILFRLRKNQHLVYPPTAGVP